MTDAWLEEESDDLRRKPASRSYALKIYVILVKSQVEACKHVWFLKDYQLLERVRYILREKKISPMIWPPGNQTPNQHLIQVHLLKCVNV